MTAMPTSSLPPERAVPAPTRRDRAGLHVQVAARRRACNVSILPMSIDSDALVRLLPHPPPFRVVGALDALQPRASVRGRYPGPGDGALLPGELRGQRGLP